MTAKKIEKKIEKSAAVGVVEPASVAPVAPVPPVESFRLSVVLVTGQEFILKFPDAGLAHSFALQIVRGGCFEDDRSADSSRYNTVLYPLAQIKQLNVYQAG